MRTRTTSVYAAFAALALVLAPSLTRAEHETANPNASKDAPQAQEVKKDAKTETAAPDKKPGIQAREAIGDLVNKRWMNRVLAMNKNNDEFVDREEFKGFPAEQFDQADANKDGKLDKKEIESMSAQMASHSLGARQRQAPGEAKPIPTADELLQHYDKNADGKIGRDEVRGRAEVQFLGQLDQDTDGFADRAELAEWSKNQKASRAAGGEGRAEGRRTPGFEERIRKFDANADGAIEKSEFEARVNEAFGSIDTNKDGKLADDELRSSRTHRLFQVLTDEPEERQMGRRGKGPMPDAKAAPANQPSEQSGGQSPASAGEAGQEPPAGEASAKAPAAEPSGKAPDPS